MTQAASLSTFALDGTCSALIVWLMVRWARLRDNRIPIAAACVLALDLQNKWLVIVVVCGLVAGFAVTGPRALFSNRAWWIAGTLAMLTGLPGLYWQATHGWPQWAMGAAIRAEQQLATGGPAGLLGQQFVQAGVLGTVLAVGGIWGFLRSAALRPYRFVLVAGVVVTAFVFLTGTRPYYTAALLPALYAAGAVVLGSWDSKVVRRLLPGLGVISLVIAVAVVLLWPLPASALRQPSDSSAQVHTRMRLYGTSGWPELTAAVTHAYRKLPSETRDKAVIVTDTYWQAAALDNFGVDLPPVYSPNRGYAYFGTPPETSGPVLYIGPDSRKTVLRNHFRETSTIEAADEPLGFPGVSRFVTVSLCTGRSESWSEIWPALQTLALDMGFAAGSASFSKESK